MEEDLHYLKFILQILCKEINKLIIVNLQILKNLKKQMGNLIFIDLLNLNNCKNFINDICVNK